MKTVFVERSTTLSLKADMPTRLTKPFDPVNVKVVLGGAKTEGVVNTVRVPPLATLKALIFMVTPDDEPNVAEPLFETR